MRRYQVTGKFPQAKAKDTFQSVSVDACDWHTASSRGLDALMDRPGIKGLQHKQIQLVITREVPEP